MPHVALFNGYPRKSCDVAKSDLYLRCFPDVQIELDQATHFTQVRDALGNTSTAAVNGTFRVGQFQFYEGYPVLQRNTGITRGNRTGQQLNTRSGSARAIAQNDSNSAYVVVSMSDGKLLPTVELSGSGTYALLDGIDEAGYYNATHY